MYRIMKRILKLTVFANLKITLILASSVYSIFFCICKVIADIFHLPSPHLSNDSPSTGDNSTQTVPHCSSPRVSTFQTEDQSIQTVPCLLNSPSSTGNSSQIPHCCSSKVSTSVQTEESTQLENFGSKSSTDVLIYNLNSSQKLVITQGKFKCNQCECLAKMAATEQDENKATPTVEVNNSNISNMSIESDVVDSKIESGCSSTSTSSDETAVLNADNNGFICQPVDNENSNTLNANSDNISFEDDDKTYLKSLNDTFNISSDFENFVCLKENDSGNTYVKCEEDTPNKQKTSSPLKKLMQSPQNVCANLSIVNANQSQMTDNKDAAIGTNSENWGRDLGTNFKRRLSLPVKLNTTNTSLANFKLAQKKLIEEALKNTKHEKSFKEIKYPFSSQISLDCKSNDEIDEKEVFSCSSYESLPVSDHLRNACTNNTLLSLCSENLLSEDDPDFSCIDNLVESFGEIKGNLLAPNLVQSKAVISPMSGIDKTEESATKLSVDFKDNTLIEGNDTNLCAEINISASVTNMCNVLDRFDSSDVKLSAKNTAKNFNESCLKTDMSDDRSKDNKSRTSDNNRTNSAAKESKSNYFLKQKREKNIRKWNQTKFKFSSPIKSRFSDLGEWSDDDDEITISSLKVKSECDNLQKDCQQSYHKIAFIDDSPKHEASQKSQNASCNSRDNSLSENEKPASVREKTSMKSKAKTSNYVARNNFHFLPAVQIGNKSIDDYPESCRNSDESFEEYPETNRMASLSSRRRLRRRQLQEWTGDCEDAVKTIRISNLGSICGEKFVTSNKVTSPCDETKHANQSILETNRQTHISTPLEENASSGDSASDNSVVTVKNLQGHK